MFLCSRDDSFLSPGRLELPASLHRRLQQWLLPGVQQQHFTMWRLRYFCNGRRDHTHTLSRSPLALSLPLACSRSLACSYALSLFATLTIALFLLPQKAEELSLLSEIKKQLAEIEAVQAVGTTNTAFVFVKPHAVTDETKALVQSEFEKRGFTILTEGTLEVRLHCTLTAVSKLCNVAGALPFSLSLSLSPTLFLYLSVPLLI